MRSELLSELSAIGYEIFLQGENIRLRYQKSDSPPESVRPLIEELKKNKVEVVNFLRSNIGSRKIKATDVVVTHVWTNPYEKGTAESRQESLVQCMGATWGKAFDRIKEVWPQGFVATPEIRAAEIEIDRIHALVLSGRANLEDFREAAEAWELAVVKVTLTTT